MKNGSKKIQAAAYNGARTVYIVTVELQLLRSLLVLYALTYVYVRTDLKVKINMVQDCGFDGINDKIKFCTYLLTTGF